MYNHYERVSACDITLGECSCKMNEEQMLNQQQTDSVGRVPLTNILYALRTHLLLIIIMTVLFAAGGAAYLR